MKVINCLLMLLLCPNLWAFDANKIKKINELITDRIASELHLGQNKSDQLKKILEEYQIKRLELRIQRQKLEAALQAQLNQGNTDFKPSLEGLRQNLEKKSKIELEQGKQIAELLDDREEVLFHLKMREIRREIHQFRRKSIEK